MKQPEQNEFAERRLDELIPLRVVAAHVKCSERTLWRKISARELPGPVKVGREACLFWGDVVAYMERLEGKRKTRYTKEKP